MLTRAKRASWGWEWGIVVRQTDRGVDVLYTADGKQMQGERNGPDDGVTRELLSRELESCKVPKIRSVEDAM